MLSASPAVARARRALNHLHLLVTSGSANNSVCFLRVHSSSWPCPRYSEQLSARSHRWSVHPAPQIFKGKPRASCEAQKRTESVRLVEPPAHDGDLVAMCMMSVGSQCGGCVCGCCVCDVHAWMPCRLGHGRACGATGRLKFSDLVPTRNGCRRNRRNGPVRSLSLSYRLCERGEGLPAEASQSPHTAGLATYSCRGY